MSGAKSIKKVIKSKKKKQGDFCNGLMTKASFFSFIRSTLRLKWMRSDPARKEALKKVSVGSDNYYCKTCKKLYSKKNVEVNHIEPVGSFNEFSQFEEFYNRLFCSVEKLEVLCKECHKKETEKQKLEKNGK